eukprot:170242-Chlamydomonas_euryale.AAC.7
MPQAPSGEWPHSPTSYANEDLTPHKEITSSYGGSVLAARLPPFRRWQVVFSGHMHILNAARLMRLRHVARMPAGSVVKQLLFAEGLVGVSGVVGRPCSTWRHRAVAALDPVLASRLAGWGWCGVAKDPAQWRSLCDGAQPAA